ncbi:hypothetical protein P4U05_16685 [Bacillus paranthracis]|uniref:DUF1433 domain-containing protein n=1 Tax=Bacillus paranthracis TaxID=2026186 RepID=A0AAJ1K5Q7_9BACI|nr:MULTISPECIES: hypothetical protein [Bacillus]ADY20413.1 hypothetical protein YBT020_05835 [Bacillus thuringiensis serovar finitimus YBT-020]MCW4577373.1 hypothetical protein [Bacillus pacificus]MDA1584292.1 hypothetical protein [Bacillus cereus group sp. TH230-1LC]MRC72895.1 hypothetical protein [Bacillus thuringiensis]OTX71353.1 hypothetical protein BK722_13160 [Bacillus thuringiensis serovar finitimus]
MSNSKKKNIIILIILAIIVLAIGCTTSFIHNRNITKERAAEVAIKTMKKEKKIDFVVTDVKIQQLELAGFIRVRGYDKNNNQKKLYVVINKSQNYKVEYWGDE